MISMDSPGSDGIGTGIENDDGAGERHTCSQQLVTDMSHLNVRSNSGSHDCGGGHRSGHGSDRTLSDDDGNGDVDDDGNNVEEHVAVADDAAAAGRGENGRGSGSVGGSNGGGRSGSSGAGGFGSGRFGRPSFDHSGSFSGANNSSNNNSNGGGGGGGSGLNDGVFLSSQDSRRGSDDGGGDPFQSDYFQGTTQ